jgi:hypothetical protein
MGDLGTACKANKTAIQGTLRQLKQREAIGRIRRLVRDQITLLADARTPPAGYASVMSNPYGIVWRGVRR